MPGYRQNRKGARVFIRVTVDGKRRQLGPFERVRVRRGKVLEARRNRHWWRIAEAVAIPKASGKGTIPMWRFTMRNCRADVKGFDIDDISDMLRSYDPPARQSVCFSPVLLGS